MNSESAYNEDEEWVRVMGNEREVIAGDEAAVE